MSELLKNIDAHTRLAGTNKLEILLFTLGAVEGMVSLRGVLVPVVDLAKYAGMGTDSPREIMIVTEYNGHTQGFLVEAVDTILRLDWSQMRVPPDMLTPTWAGSSPR